MIISACSGTPLVSDGGFEQQEPGIMQEPFHIKHNTMPERYVVIRDETAFEGSQFVRMNVRYTQVPIATVAKSFSGGIMMKYPDRNGKRFTLIFL
jgi:hypothetical protein